MYCVFNDEDFNGKEPLEATVCWMNPENCRVKTFQEFHDGDVVGDNKHRVSLQDRDTVALSWANEEHAKHVWTVATVRLHDEIAKDSVRLSMHTIEALGHPGSVKGNRTIVSIRAFHSITPLVSLWLACDEGSQPSVRNFLRESLRPVAKGEMLCISPVLRVIVVDMQPHEFGIVTQRTKIVWNGERHKTSYSHDSVVIPTAASATGVGFGFGFGFGFDHVDHVNVDSVNDNFNAATTFEMSVISLINPSGTDKAILPDSVLQCLLKAFPNEGQLKYPIIFKVRNKASGAFTHCGVLEFTAGGDVMLLPPWVMKNSGSKDGDRVVLELCQLVPMEWVKLQAMGPELALRLKNPKKRLEYALSKITCLTTGDMIPLQLDKEYLLRVIECKPRKAGCLVDTTVNVEFVSPFVVDPSERVLHLPESVIGIVREGHHDFFRAKIEDRSRPVVIEMCPDEHDADLFVSGVNPRPTLLDSEYKSMNVDEQKERIVVDAPVPKWLYISVGAYKSDSPYILTIRYKSDERDDHDAAGFLGDEHHKHGGFVMGQGIKQNPFHVMCRHCGSFMPSSRLPLHEIRCERMSWTCPICKRLLPRNSKHAHIHCPQCETVCASPEKLKKHADRAHHIVPCPQCGQDVELANLTSHRDNECCCKPRVCKFCTLAFSSDAIEAHEDTCGGKTISCDLCSKRMPTLKLRYHQLQECPGSAPSRAVLGRHHSDGAYVCPYCLITVSGGNIRFTEHLESCEQGPQDNM